MKLILTTLFTITLSFAQTYAAQIQFTDFDQLRPVISQEIKEADVKKSWCLANNYYSLSQRSELGEEIQKQHYKKAIDYLENYLQKNKLTLTSKRVKKIASIYENQQKNNYGSYLWGQAASYWHSYVLHQAKSCHRTNVARTPQMIEAYKHAALTNQKASSFLFIKEDKKKKLAKRAASYWSNIAKDITSPDERELAMWAIYGLQHDIQEKLHEDKKEAYQAIIDTLTQKYKIGGIYSFGDSIHEIISFLIPDESSQK